MNLRKLSILIVALIPSYVFAHGGHGSGVVEGFTHPIFGLDHFIAIFGTGFLAYLLSPPKSLLQLGAFVALMVVGGMVGVGQEAIFAVEKTIAFSVLIIGILIAFDIKAGLYVLLLLFGVFGFVHGFAHGAEMSESNTILKYASGYALGAMLTGILGMLCNRMLSKSARRVDYIKIVGGAIIGAGIMIILS